MPVRLSGTRGRLLMSTGMGSKAAAEGFERKLQRLHEIALIGTGLDAGLMDFVSRLDDGQRARLVRHGCCGQRRPRCADGWRSMWKTTSQPTEAGHAIMQATCGVI